MHLNSWEVGTMRSGKYDINKEDCHQNILNERIERYGHDALLDEEILHFLTGIQVVKMKELIEKHGIQEVVKYLKNDEFTRTQIKKIKLLFEFARRISNAPFKEKTALDSSSKAGQFVKNELQFLSSEVFIVIFLDSQNRKISMEIVSEGTINEAAVYPREIVKLALMNNATGVILGHNHPAGSKLPSASDIQSTKAISSALNTINVKVIDHIIACEDSYISFAERGLL
jgi:DNA repair protein RadC